MDKTILITGGAGFLGSHLSETLVSNGQNVLCVDNFSSGNKQNIEHLLPDSNFDILNQDIRIPDSLPPVDKIYHLASRASPTDFMEYPVEIALANTQGTRRLLDHARACDAKMVFASTSEIYGDPEVHPQPETYNGNVSIRGPRGCYDESKRFGETLTVAYKRKYDVDVRTVRIFNTYGPRMRPDDGRVVPTFITQALQGKDLTVYGDGEQTRSFCYVSDLVRGLERVMDINNHEHNVFNLGQENERTIRQLANIIIKKVDSSSGITFEPLPEDDPSRRKPDISRAKSELGWEPNISVHQGLERTIRWFEEIINTN